MNALNMQEINTVVINEQSLQVMIVFISDSSNNLMLVERAIFQTFLKYDPKSIIIGKETVIIMIM